MQLFCCRSIYGRCISIRYSFCMRGPPVIVSSCTKSSETMTFYQPCLFSRNLQPLWHHSSLGNRCSRAKVFLNLNHRYPFNPIMFIHPFDESFQHEEDVWNTHNGVRTNGLKPYTTLTRSSRHIGMNCDRETKAVLLLSVEATVSRHFHATMGQITYR